MSSLTIREILHKCKIFPLISIHPLFIGCAFSYLTNLRRFVISRRRRRFCRRSRRFSFLPWRRSLAALAIIHQNSIIILVLVEVRRGRHKSDSDLVPEVVPDIGRAPHILVSGRRLIYPLSTWLGAV